MKKQLKMMNHHFKFQDFNSAEFKDHISRSIPNYNGMRSLLPSLASNFLVSNSNIYDIGCSAGDLIFELQDKFSFIHKDLSYIGYDIAENLLPDLETAPNCSFFPRDVTEESLTMFNTSLVFSLFTLQFIPLPKRIKLINKVYNSLDKRGAFFVCEKIYSESGITEDLFTFSNYDLKMKNKFIPKDIMKKQKDLRGVMFPLTKDENEKIFKEAGFSVVEVFFKSLNFIGWVLIK